MNGDWISYEMDGPIYAQPLPAGWPSGPVKGPWARLEIDRDIIPRTTSREEWKKIDRWERMVRNLMAYGTAFLPMEEPANIKVSDEIR